MEFVQDFLTAAVQVIAIAGFGGIALHAIYKQHAKTAAIYAEVPRASAAPQVEPATEVDTALLTAVTSDPQSDTGLATEVEATLESPDIPPHQEAIADIWDSGVSTSAPRYWVRQPKSIKPTLALMPAKEEAQPAAPTRTATKKAQQALEINLNSLDSAALRKLCSKHGINWRNARGQGKHLTKAAMIFQLEQKTAA